MFRPKKRLTPFRVFAIAFILYFGIHVIVGFTHCIITDYANCPGNEALFTDEDVTTDDKN
jgi:hypothetical protein